MKIWISTITLIVSFNLTGCLSLSEQQPKASTTNKQEISPFEKMLAKAKQGDASAQFKLGVKHDFGQGVAKDDKQAVYWYQKSAMQGHAPAQYNLGVMYANGRGVAKDDKQAVYWYQKAAMQGNATAQNNLGVRYEYGQGVIEDDARAVYWYQKAAQNGNKSAQKNLAYMLANGDGIKRSYRLSKMWQLLAQYNGADTKELSRWLNNKLSKNQLSQIPKLANQCLNSNYIHCQ
ncbi:tetratricopeptide repeat protein [Photobacterium angustum]|uniref:tetratricopeptide repeat protein n=1 Tax=Photobacterium angustum TaxID=661 RepID=UPI00069C7627|nr:tetratricopeptide repeat protein [Photobacterium angustum]